jgi:hypothetical protein
MAALHGMGPKALDAIKAALRAQGKSLAQKNSEIRCGSWIDTRTGYSEAGTPFEPRGDHEP